MESKLTHTCEQIRPGMNYALLYVVALLGLAVGGLMGAFIAHPFGFVMMMGGIFGLPVFVAYVKTRDGRLSDDECSQLLNAAESPSAQSLVRDLYCEKGYLMKSDANRIFEWVQQQKHADLQLRMGCAR